MDVTGGPLESSFLSYPPLQLLLFSFGKGKCTVEYEIGEQFKMSIESSGTNSGAQHIGEDYGCIWRVRSTSFGHHWSMSSTDC